MIHFEGTQSFPQPVAEVAAKLGDAGFLAHCVPEAEVSQALPDRAVGKVKPKLSFLTGGLTIEADVTAREPGKSVSYQLISKVIGASSTITAKLDFTEAESGGTTVNWHGDLTALTGLLKMVPKGLMEASAKKVIDEMWESVGKKLHATGGTLEWKA